MLGLVDALVKETDELIRIFVRSIQTAEQRKRQQRKQVGSAFDVQRWTFGVRSLLTGAMPEGRMRTSNAQHRTPNLEPREMERAMSADYDLEECAQHPNGRAKEAVATHASRFDVRCSALDVRSSFLAY